MGCKYCDLGNHRGHRLGCPQEVIDRLREMVARLLSEGVTVKTEEAATDLLEETE